MNTRYVDVQYHTGVQDMPEGWYRTSMFNIFKPYPDLMLVLWKADVDFMYIKSHSGVLTKEEFKLELELRKTSIWKAVNGKI